MNPGRLAVLAAAFQREEIIPRCGSCRKVCCRLESLVLELGWRRLAALWGVRGSRRAFDAALARGEGPPEIRAEAGFYYAHGAPCPAYSEADGTCRVYGGWLKPPGCGDFPVYADGDGLVADLRCGSLDERALGAFLERAIEPGECFVRSEDPDFPFLVTFRIRRARRKRSRRREVREKSARGSSGAAAAGGEAPAPERRAAA
jgi:Fe-S-cluster containining protein